MGTEQSSLARTPRIAKLENRTVTPGPELRSEQRPGDRGLEHTPTQAREFVNGFQQLVAGKSGPRSQEQYEKKFFVKVTPEEFSQLRDELMIDSESDHRSGNPTSLCG